MRKWPVQRWLVLGVGLVCIAASGCFSAHDDTDSTATESQPDDSGDDDGDYAEPDDEALDGDEREDGEWVDGHVGCDGLGNPQQVLERYCAGCHALGQPTPSRLTDVLSSDFLVANGFVIPDDPESSPIYQRMSARIMPPAGEPQPSDDEIEQVRSWIACGAYQLPVDPGPPPFTSIDTRLRAMAEDLERAPEQVRRDVRYIDLTPYANRGYPEKALQEYLDALDFVVNSLSREPLIAPLAPVGGQPYEGGLGTGQLIVRLELGDYGWSAETWESIVASYPYAVRYDPDSPLFPNDEELAQRLRDQTGTSVPYVQAEWFVAQVLSAPLYHDILQLPASLSALERELGVDLAADVASATAARGAVRESVTALHQRVIDHHVIDEERGLWITHDFASDTGTADVFAHPLDFEAVTQQVRLDLSNGLAAYMIVDASGQRLDVAPEDALIDPSSRDGRVHAGLSCLSCHARGGVIGFTDQLRATLSSSGDPLLRDLYRPQRELDALLLADYERHLEALSDAGITQLRELTTHTIDQRYRDELALDDAAAALGVPTAELELAADHDSVSQELLAPLLDEGGTMERADFEAILGELVVALQLGEPLVGR
jgi:hypothetical protein